MTRATSVIPTEFNFWWCDENQSDECGIFLGVETSIVR